MSIAAFTVGCSRETEVWRHDGRTMGTTYSVQAVGYAAADSSLIDAIDVTLDDVETEFSTYLPASEVSRFNASRSTDWFPVSDSVCALIERALSLGALSNGAFDITVAPLVDAWGFGPDFDVRGIPTAAEVQKLLGRVGRHLLQTDCDAPAIRKSVADLNIDLSGMAKGYAVDTVAAALERYGIERYLVEIGGEIRARGRNAQNAPWAVAIEHPLSPTDAPPLVAHLDEGAVATSGDYRNFVEVDGRRYSHNIDPRSGYPIAHDLTAVAVLSASAADADALATALLVLGLEAGMELAERESISAAFLVNDDGRLVVHESSRLAAR